MTQETHEAPVAVVEEQAPPTVTVRDLVIKYGDYTAVRGISFDVRPGEVVGLLGGNGAGKSSTMRALATISPAHSGRIIIAGYDVADVRQMERARTHIGYCPDVGGLVRSATPREHIGLTLSMHGKAHLWDNALALVERFNLTRVLDQPTSGFSHGMSRRLSVILAALASNHLLILDEPFDGVDPTGVDETIALINEARDAGLSVILSTHLQEVLTRATDRVLVMVQGQILDDAPAEAYRGDEGVERYVAILEGVDQQ